MNLAEDGTLELKASFADAALGNLTDAVISYGLVNGVWHWRVRAKRRSRQRHGRGV